MHVCVHVCVCVCVYMYMYVCTYEQVVCVHVVLLCKYQLHLPGNIM